VRAEYPLAVTRLKQALKQARDHGFLGENIVNSGFSFDLNIREGAGAFCLRGRNSTSRFNRG